MKYKNLSYATRTFYGVTFRPQEVKDVPGYINDHKFIRVDLDDSKVIEPTKEAPKRAAKVAKPRPAKKTTKAKKTVNVPEPKIDEDLEPDNSEFEN